jgi:glycosyltransferase involved in cell wall biosynthesis
MDISIIICTYNPDERIFSRCLTAVKNLCREGLDCEVIIIDNNSVQPVSSLEYVKELIHSVPGSRVIVEKEQGLAYARIGGFKNATGSIIIFFDDDNEPAADYLTQAKEIMDARPFIGVMGPGNIHVDYIDGADPWIRERLNSYFQQKAIDREEYILSIMHWAPCYPPGTGQVMRRVVFQKYLETFYHKGLKTSDRKGNDLSSAGDSQIIWSSLDLNLAVGHHPLLKINHLIPAARANLNYLKRLNFYLDLSGTLAFVEMFPEKKSTLPAFHNSSFLYNLFKIYFNGFKSREYKSININVGALVGKNQAYSTVQNNKVPFLLRAAKKIYRL